MRDPLRNRTSPEDLTDGDVEAALDRIGSRDEVRGRDAHHTYETLTWGEGPGHLSQAGVQDWLWYRLPKDYACAEAGTMARLAGSAAELFDELGLDAYAGICRSSATTALLNAFECSDLDGFKLMRKAFNESGIKPPDLDDFAWGSVMGIEEVGAMSAVEAVLERAVADGDLRVGGRGWRIRQKELSAAALDADHPTQPGQSWRTAVLTERLGRWTDEIGSRSETLTFLRRGVANRLVHPIQPPPDVANCMKPLTWLLDAIGDEQVLTAAGYLNKAFVLHAHAHRPWLDPFPDPSGKPPRSEVDDITLLQLREWLQTVGALRKRGRVLRRTKRGSEMASDPAMLWRAVAEGLGPNPWSQFVVETYAVGLLTSPNLPREELEQFVAAAAGASGWQTSGPSGHQDPTGWDVSSTFRGVANLLGLLGMDENWAEWRNRQIRLSPAGEQTLLAAIRPAAVGPRSRP